jgi:hypothetical protein
MRIVLVCLGLTLCSAPAFAAQPPDEARRHLLAADQAARAQDYARALEEYRAAQAVQPSREALLGLADAHYRLGNTVPAYDAYDALERDYGSRLSAPERAMAQQRKQELAAKTGTLSIQVSEAGADVALDGQGVGASPLPAALRVLVGARKLRVAKTGFVTNEQTVTVPSNGKLAVTVALAPETRPARVTVREKSAQALHVVIDGHDLGPAPYAGEIAAGRHEIGGRGEGLLVEPRTISAEQGGTLDVVLDARPEPARVELRISDGKGTITLDGKPVGEGTFSGEVAPGKHTFEIRRDGCEAYTASVQLAPGQVLSQSVALRLQAKTEPVETQVTRLLRGFYGGFALAPMFLPAGAGSTPESSCDALGASTCEAPVPWGPAIGAYVGYSFDPVGFELMLAGLADYAKPTVSFDGRQGSLVNPLVATPARDEEFLIFRAGVLVALRLRSTIDFDVVRLAFAGGLGLSYRKLWMRRDATALDGTNAQAEFAPDPVEYVSPGISLELGLVVPLTEVAQLTVGASFWGESAFNQARTATSSDEALLSPDDSTPARPLHTPAYDLAQGPQIYLGPQIGMQFGP